MSVWEDDPHRSFGLGNPSPANDQSLKPIRDQLVALIDLVDKFEETQPTETEQRLMLSQVVISLDKVRTDVLEIEYACLKVPNTDARPQSEDMIRVQE